MRWDVFAAIVALAGIPLMLSSATTWLLRVATRRFMRFAFSNGSTCERLEWDDIPEGPLRIHGAKKALLDRDYYGYRYDATSEVLQHKEEECFTSTIGRVFHNAWISARRREVKVDKPQQLNPRKTYIRTDSKTVRAYALMCHEVKSNTYDREPVIQFVKVNGILTAHLTAVKAQLPDLTKHEIEAILDGYPPFYLEKIHLSETAQVNGPISNPEDITRAGWIVAIGLDCYNSHPLWTHNMAPSRLDDEHFPPGRRFRISKPPWTATVMAHAVKRFGHTLDNLEKAFPSSSFAKSFFSDLTTGKYDLDVTRPMDVLYDSELFEEKSWEDRSYIASLSSDQWQVAMQAFNHYEPLTQEEQNLFRDFMRPILRAAFVGLLQVLLYGNHYRKSLPVWSLPAFPELVGKKYVYLTTCTPVE